MEEETPKEMVLVEWRKKKIPTGEAEAEIHMDVVRTEWRKNGEVEEVIHMDMDSPDGKAGEYSRLKLTDEQWKEREGNFDPQVGGKREKVRR